MNNLLLTALSAMDVAQHAAPTTARNYADDPVDDAQQGRACDDFAEQLLPKRHNDNTEHANKDRRKKNAAGHGCHGRRVIDWPD